MDNEQKDVYIKQEIRDIEYEDDDDKHSIKNEISIDTVEKIETSFDETSPDEIIEEIVDDTTCKICNNKFDTPELLQTHLRKRRLAHKLFKCCLCGKSFRDNSQLGVHVRKHTGEKPYECTQCGKKFSVNGNLNKHLRIHTGEKRFECDTCEKKFTQFAHLEDHMKIHTGESPYQCDLCNSSFKTKSRLTRHKVQHGVGVPKRSIQCPACAIILKSTGLLEIHLQTHIKGNPDFRCEQCNKKYKSLYTLYMHKKQHDSPKIFKCNLCTKTFRNQSHLRRHENSHAGVKPYCCDICLRAFPCMQNLNRHRLTHTGEKPYSCEECSRSFLTLENLNRHKRTHTGEKPYTCEVCNKSFAHSTTLKEHRLTHTGEKPYGCNICGKKFSLNKSLYKHIRINHPDDYATYKEINELPKNLKAPIANELDIKLEEPEYVNNEEIKELIHDINVINEEPNKSEFSDQMCIVKEET